MTFSLEDLNQVQLDAVKQTQGAVLILAGAGTGKTRVLTTRIAYILNQGLANPHEILALTFTNKAAKEMKERILSMLSTEVEGWFVGTFHSVCNRILRMHVAEVGLQPNFVILDTDDVIRVIKQILVDKNIDEKVLPPKLVDSVISTWKDRALTPDMVVASSKAESNILEIYKIYQDNLKRLNAVDFGDLILHVITLFKNNKDIITKWQRRFKYVLVDEYQDTNVAQYLLLRLVSAGYGNICCVGDDDQSIYSWRGAEVANILNFQKDFENAHVFRLEQNYRSSGHILGAANILIEKNSARLGKKLWTEYGDGSKIKVQVLPSADSEGSYLATEVEKLANIGVSLSDIAILVRAGHQTRVIEEQFLARAIPYKIVGGTKFYEREEIRDIIAYLRIIYQPNDDLAFIRIINKPRRGIGDTSIQKLRTYASSKVLSLVNAVVDTPIVSEIGGKAGKSLSDFVNSLSNWQVRASELSLKDFTEEVIEDSGYMAMWREDKTEESKARQENIKELVGTLNNFESLEEFLEHVSLVMDYTDIENDPKVSMMTMHGAKGLEFDTVFLPGWEEGIFPSQRSLDETGNSGLEEERRLAYVGITRAKKNAIITYAMQRMVFGKWNNGISSRFIKELPEEHVDKPTVRADVNQFSTSNANKAWTSANSGIFRNLESVNVSKSKEYFDGEGSVSRAKFKIGDTAKHKLFGEGKVVEISGEKATVRFKDGIERKIITSFLDKA